MYNYFIAVVARNRHFIGPYVMRNKLLKRRLFMKERRRKMEKRSQELRGNRSRITAPISKPEHSNKISDKDNAKMLRPKENNSSFRLNLEAFFDESIDEINSNDKQAADLSKRLPVTFNSSFAIPFSPMRRPVPFQGDVSHSSHSKHFSTSFMMDHEVGHRSLVTPTQA